MTSPSRHPTQTLGHRESKSEARTSDPEKVSLRWRYVQGKRGVLVEGQEGRVAADIRGVCSVRVRGALGNLLKGVAVFSTRELASVICLSC